jgi:hypothetical protein
LEAVDRRGRRLWFWRLAPAAIAAAVLLVIAVTAPTPVELLALQMPTPPAAPEVRFTPRPVRVRTLKAAVPGAAMIRLETADPNVVILLIAD